MPLTKSPLLAERNFQSSSQLIPNLLFPISFQFSIALPSAFQHLTSKALASFAWFNLIVDVSDIYIERFGLDVFSALGIANIWIVLLVQETPMESVHVHRSKGENSARFPQTSPSPLDILLTDGSDGLEKSGEIMDGAWSDITDNGGFIFQAESEFFQVFLVDFDDWFRFGC